MASISQNFDERRLLIQGTGELSNGDTVSLLILVDTGAEVNVINMSKVEGDVWTPLTKPWRLLAANQQQLGGGDKELTNVLQLMGHQVDTGQECSLKIPTNFVAAELSGIDAMVSYSWLAEHNFLVNGKRHGICYQGPNSDDMIWIAGIKKEAQLGQLKMQSSLENEEKSHLSMIPVKDFICIHPEYWIYIQAQEV